MTISWMPVLGGGVGISYLDTLKLSTYEAQEIYKFSTKLRNEELKTILKALRPAIG